ncbi:F-box/kelch-repeat protein At3g23880-like [Solanum stenotomum]|uniref:F-box/kelch-repeat protein At3g23880-like n=1 Tax=Solanum stenotomum TaxID=172797 RepID=UPI0020D02B09|nr:F-box/kelch-repeat protein At3g23880-like [Solanum stenotomum]
MVMRTHILEEEILIDILTKLPVKSLFRFKCVSKSCKTLLTEPYFKKKHHNHAKNQPDSRKLLIRIRDKMDSNLYCTSLSPNRLLVNDIHTVPKPPFSRYRMYCCCDALFLIGIWTEPSQDDEPSMLLLWNPTTSESIVLPPLESPEQESTYGLGYDSTSDDYKVLRIDKDGSALDEIVALKSGSWRKIYSPSVRPVGDVSLLYGKECLPFVNGAFHWLGIEESMMSLNISDETYKRIPLHKNMSLYLESVTIEEGLSVLGSMICLFNRNDITFNLWMMKEYGVQESWIKLLTLPCNGAFSIIPIYSFSDGKVLLRYECPDELRGMKVIYRTCDHRIWSFDIDPLSFILSGFVYMESLINPREIDVYPIHKQTDLTFLRKRKREDLLK